MKDPDSERNKLYVEIWAKAVETQMHFNEMSVKSRQIGLAFVAAALGLSVVLLSRREDFSFAIGRIELHVSVVLLITAFFALWAVKLLDLDVYHRMLRGAVTFGEDFEEHYMKQVFQLSKGMTQAISHFSRYQDAGRTIGPDGKYQYTGDNKLSAELKIRRFYNYAGVALVTAALALFGVTNIKHWNGGDHRQAPVSEVKPAATLQTPSAIAEPAQRSTAHPESQLRGAPNKETPPPSAAGDQTR
jgi:hypothetical protein